MGNQHKNGGPIESIGRSKSQMREAELTDTQSMEPSVYQQHDEQSNCLGCISYKKTILKKIDWEYKFIRNCEEVMKEFEWVKDLMETITNFDSPKLKYNRQVNNLKKQKCKIPTPADNKLSDKDLDAFKKNLKKSVIMSFGGSKINDNSRISVAGINVKKSRIEAFKKQIPKSDSISSDCNLRESFIGLDDNQFSKDKISKQITHQLQIFIKFCSILEIHFNDNSCILGKVKLQFIKLMNTKYSDASKAKDIGDFVDDVTQFLILLKFGVIDYYNLQSFSEKDTNLLISNEENIHSLCTSILFKDHQFYNLLFTFISSHFKEQQDKFIKILDLLKGSGPQKFTVKDKFCLNHRTFKTYINQMSMSSEQNYVQNIMIPQQQYQPYRHCLEYLRQVGKSRSPINKMKSIVSCSEGITKEIQLFYDQNCLKKQKWMLDADQIMSIFSYIIVAARVEHLHTQLFIIQNFATGLQLINMAGYYSTVLNGAVQHLQNEFSHLVKQEQ